MLDRLIPFAIYVGIGLTLHAMFHADVINWQSAWTFAYLLGWPVLVFVWVWKWLLIIAAIFIVGGIGVAIWESR